MGVQKRTRKYVSRAKQVAHRVYLVMFLLGVSLALVYVLVFPAMHKNRRFRSTAEGGSRRDAGAAQIQLLKDANTTLSNDYRQVVEQWASVTNLLAETMVDYAVSTSRVDALTVEMEQCETRLNYERSRHAANDSDRVQLVEQIAALKQDLLGSQQALVTATEESSRLLAERVPRAEHVALQAIVSELDKALEQLQGNLEEAQHEQSELEAQLVMRDQALARVLAAVDKKRLDREMLTSVLAAKLRLLEYDVDWAMRALSRLDEWMEQNEAVNLEDGAPSVAEILQRLRESRQLEAMRVTLDPKE